MYISTTAAKCNIDPLLGPWTRFLSHTALKANISQDNPSAKLFSGTKTSVHSIIY